MIGSQVCRDLVSRLGSKSIYGVDRESVHDSSLTAHQFSIADVSRTEIVELLDEIRPSLVVHAAAHPGGRSLVNPTVNVEVNALGSMRVFEWCARNQCKVLYLSSSIVYGEVVPIPIKEDAPTQPRTIYGVGKVACERWLELLGFGYELDWIILRLFSTYGAGHRPSVDQGIVNVILTQLELGGDLVVKGSLSRLRDLVHVSDASQAICAAIDVWPSRQILNVCTGMGTSVGELIAWIAAAKGLDISKVQLQEVEGTIGDPQYNVGNPTLALQRMGFKSQILPRAGIAQLLSQRRSNRV